MKPTIPDFSAALARLPAPANYYLGQMAEVRDLPNNVLLFVRHAFSAQEERHDSEHHRFVLMVSLHGPGEVCLNECLLHLGEGEAVLVFPYQLHHYLNPRAERRWLFLTFEQAAAEPLLPLRNRTVRLTPAAFATLRKILDAYLAALAVPDDLRRRQCLILNLAVLLQELLLAAAATDAPAAQHETPDTPPNARSLVVDRLNRLVHGRLEQRWTQDALARELRISASHLRFLIRQALGLSLSRYLMRVRLHHAASLLAEGRLTVAETATACGFASVFAFSRAFKRETGVPPSRLHAPSPAVKRHG